MRVWIDLANSPHPLLFAPVARRLEAEGAALLVTARDNAQTLELARQRWDRVERIGGETPPALGAKAGAISGRVVALARWAARARPDVALSHNSYAQIAAARAIGVPAVTAMDFEGQPSNHLAFRLARRVVLPEAIDGAAVARQGARAAKVVRYPGLKEELYLGDFEPDPGAVARAGVEREQGTVLVVARTPPGRAVYHRFGNDLFAESIETLARQEHVVTVLLTRHADERQAFAGLGDGRLVMPERAVDSRSLVREADLMLGGGGTMTREAALMGIPARTVFAGARPAVDEWLERRGLLRRLRSASELDGLRPRESSPLPIEEVRRRSKTIEDVFVETTIQTASGGGRR